MITYCLTLSKVFPKNHIRNGEQTNFEEAFRGGQIINEGGKCNYRHPKLHTIRANYDFWARRFKKIEAGKACLSIRQWTGKPYCSKQVEITRLTRENGIGMQKFWVVGCSVKHPMFVDTHPVDCRVLANNDGLCETDWRNWFAKYDLTGPLALIHFTKFRY